MMVGKLLEVGVAVNDLPGASRTFAKLLRAPLTDTVRAPMFAMEFRMCRLGEVDFELMTPCAADGTIGRFISRWGEGLHHVAFQVSDISETISNCRARGVPVLSDEPVLLGGLRAAFLHPECMSGLLVEFVENQHGWEAVETDGVETDFGRIVGFGMAVGNVDVAAAAFSNVLGADISARIWCDRAGDHIRRATIGGVRFDLLPTTAQSGGGSGLRHVSLAVRDPEAFDAVRDPSIIDGAAGSDGGFLTDPAACHGVAFEILPQEHLSAVA